MHLSTVDMIKQKMLDAQENVRDYQEYSGKVDDPEVDELFKRFAEDNAMHAHKLREVLHNKYGDK